MRDEPYLLILMYHNIFVDEPVDCYSVRAEAFEQQVSRLSSEGFTCVVPETMGNAADRRQVMISFDDGYLSDYALAMPILAKYGFRGVSFVTTSHIGRQGYMTWEQLKMLAASGFSVQSHTHTHPLLECLSDREVERELVYSKELLEANLDVSVTGLSLPGGSMPERVSRMAGAAGYRYVFSSMPGLNPLPLAAETVLCRFRVNPRILPADFARIASGDTSAYRLSVAGYRLIQAVKKSIGPEAYHSLWKRMRKKEKI